MIVSVAISATSQRRDTIRHTLKNVKCQIKVAGKLSYESYNGGVVVNREDILADPIIRTAGCGDYIVISFEMLLTVNGNTYKAISNSNQFTTEMLDFIKVIGTGSHVLVQSVQYQLPNGKTGWLPGINLIII